MDPLGDWIDVAPWRCRRLLILRVMGNEIDQAATLGDKRKLVTEAAGTLIAVWPGEWSTSARVFAPGDTAKVVERLG